MSSPIFAATACLAALSVAGCAADPAAKTGSADAPVAHEYRTGSILAQKEKHVTTEEERRRAQEMAAEIRSSPQTIVARP